MLNQLMSEMFDRILAEIESTALSTANNYIHIPQTIYIRFNASWLHI